MLKQRFLAFLSEILLSASHRQIEPCLPISRRSIRIEVAGFHLLHECLAVSITVEKLSAGFQGLKDPLIRPRNDFGNKEVFVV